MKEPGAEQLSPKLGNARGKHGTIRKAKGLAESGNIESR